MCFMTRILVINLVIYLKFSTSEQNMLIHLMPRTNETKNYKLQVVISTKFLNSKWNITLRIISCKLQLLPIHQTINKTQTKNYRLQMWLLLICQTTNERNPQGEEPKNTSPKIFEQQMKHDTSIL